MSVGRPCEELFAADVASLGDDMRAVSALAADRAEVSACRVQSPEALAAIFMARTLEGFPRCAPGIPRATPKGVRGLAGTLYAVPPGIEEAFRDSVWSRVAADSVSLHLQMYREFVRPGLAHPAALDRIAAVADALLERTRTPKVDAMALLLATGKGVSVAELIALVPFTDIPGTHGNARLQDIAAASGVPLVVVFAVCVWRLVETWGVGFAGLHGNLQALVSGSGVTAGAVIACMRALNAVHLLGNDNPVSRGIAFAAAGCNLFDRSQYNVERYCHNIDDRTPGCGDTAAALLAAKTWLVCDAKPRFSSDTVCAEVSMHAWAWLYGHCTPDKSPDTFDGFAPFSRVPNPAVLKQGEHNLRLPAVFSRDEKHAALAEVPHPSITGAVNALVPPLRVYALTIPSGYLTVCDCFQDAAPAFLGAPRIPDMCPAAPLLFFSTPAGVCPRILRTDPVLLRVVIVLVAICHHFCLPVEIGAMIASRFPRDIALFRASPHPPIGLPRPRALAPDTPLSIFPLPVFENAFLFR
jgi:hypothetical protein